MSWSLSGQWTESCTCSVTCPCNLNEDPTHGYCDVAFCFEVKNGAIDGLDVSGITVVWTVNLPGAFMDGNATARIYIDENASSQQREALEPIFLGQRGGVWEVLSGIVSQWLPTRFTKISIGGGESPSITVGDVGTIKWEPVLDHRGVPAVLMDPPLLTPLSVEKFEVHRGQGTQWRDPDMKEWAGVHAGRTTFTWQSEPANA